MATMIFTEPPAYTPGGPTLNQPRQQDDVLEDVLRPSSSTPPPAYTERTARKFNIISSSGTGTGTGTGIGILNASIIDAVTGRLIYTTSTDPKIKKTSVQRRRRVVGVSTSSSEYLLSDSDTESSLTCSSSDNEGIELARFGWDRSSPRVRLLLFDVKKKKKQPKVKCKDWLPLVGTTATSKSNTLRYGSRLLTLHDMRYIITERKDGVGYLLRADNNNNNTSSPTSFLPLARWRATSSEDAIVSQQRLELFEETITTPGLFDALVLALVVLQSRQPLGDDLPDSLDLTSPKFYGVGDLTWR
ncbi:hypothetical protein B0F90DRAFT_1351054 [Multifurca ochricompacta]|uniref:Ig-like domain-containing protein n=1 Tax=Multifurca ochricompacta TaxID=376703 RepID=A0AAD4LXB9_9AGAM|nr:hypothetical protein B0F90DRAFT_1351054 [Multifurca ochricompacta]